MTIKRFLFISFLEWGLMLALKFFYFGGYLGSGSFGGYFYFFLIALVTLILVRRLGIISYFEAIFTSVFWSCLFVFLDLIITSAFLGTQIFRVWQFWVGFFVMVFVIFFLHKKRHIHVRHELHAKHHGHHH